jgi:hypothetical protein
MGVHRAVGVPTRADAGACALPRCACRPMVRLAPSTAEATLSMRKPSLETRSELPWLLALAVALLGGWYLYNRNVLGDLSRPTPLSMAPSTSSPTARIPIRRAPTSSTSSTSTTARTSLKVCSSQAAARAAP